MTIMKTPPNRLATAKASRDRNADKQRALGRSRYGWWVTKHEKDLISSFLAGIRKGSTATGEKK
jgi:hypothetical protein